MDYKEIKKAQEEYEYLTGDEEERRIAFLREKAIRDENSIFDAGKDIGFKWLCTTEKKFNGVKNKTARQALQKCDLLFRAPMAPVRIW